MSFSCNSKRTFWGFRSFWSDLEELRAHWQVGQTWEPEMDRVESEKLYRGWQKAVQRTFNWVE